MSHSEKQVEDPLKPACAVRLCKPGAQVVAIIPRSFMNGAYFKPFRYWLVDRVALTHVHVFDARDKAFADDDILQENVILRLVVDAEQGRSTPWPRSASKWIATARCLTS